jgi:HEAT repeat protein
MEFYLRKLKSRDFDAAFHGLIEVDSAIVPELIEAYRKETDPGIRSELVRIIWQHRQALLIPFLGEALSDSSPEVWKSALDGLVALASPDALTILNAALTRTFTTEKEADTFRKWVQEAIDQLVAKQINSTRRP